MRKWNKLCASIRIRLKLISNSKELGDNIIHIFCEIYRSSGSDEGFKAVVKEMIKNGATNSEILQYLKQHAASTVSF